MKFFPCSLNFQFFPKLSTVLFRRIVFWTLVLTRPRRLLYRFNFFINIKYYHNLNYPILYYFIFVLLYRLYLIILRNFSGDISIRNRVSIFYQINFSLRQSRYRFFIFCWLNVYILTIVSWNSSITKLTFFSLNILIILFILNCFFICNIISFLNLFNSHPWSWL